MFSYVWPIALVVCSNVFYQIFAKETPEAINPFASLTITYAVATVFSGILFFVLNKDLSLFAEYSKTNWVPFAFGLTLVGLEVGFIYAYKAGWQVSTAPVVQSAALAVILLFVGLVLYKEPLSWNKIVGCLVCLAGLYFINMK